MGEGGDGSSFAAKLDHLFRTVRRRDGSEVSYREVARAIESAGVGISPSYLQQLRTGIKDNPTKRHIEALATFFGVPPAYFFDEALAAEVDAQLDLLLALRDANVRDLALRADGLSAESLRVVAEMVRRARQLEGLDGGPGAGRRFDPAPRNGEVSGDDRGADPAG